MGGSRNRAALLPTWMSPFFSCTKEQIHLWLGTGWYRPSFSSRRDEPLSCYHELLLLVYGCSLTDETPGRDPATCCPKSCHQVLWLEMPLDKHPCVLPQVRFFPLVPVEGSSFPFRMALGSLWALQELVWIPELCPIDAPSILAISEVILPLPSEVYLRFKPVLQQDRGSFS